MRKTNGEEGRDRFIYHCSILSANAANFHLLCFPSPVFVDPATCCCEEGWDCGTHPGRKGRVTKGHILVG